MKCQNCGQETFLPFQCPYCGGQFCSLDRLPENHSCPKIQLARASRNEEAAVLQTPKSYEYTITFRQPRVTKGRVYFSPKELKHLAFAALLVAGVGLSAWLYSDLSSPEQWMFGLLVFGVFAIVLTGSFLSHEIAHKVTAQRRGLWAEFRLTMWGALLTLVSMVSPLFKIISPGAVVISGSTSKGEIGKISLAGPTTNLLLSVVFLGLTAFRSQFSEIFFLAAFLNGFMALFNLIPIGILDGFKIFVWNKKVWLTAFASSVLVMAIAYWKITF